MVGVEGFDAAFFRISASRQGRWIRAACRTRGKRALPAHRNPLCYRLATLRCGWQASASQRSLAALQACSWGFRLGSLALCLAGLIQGHTQPLEAAQLSHPIECRMHWGSRVPVDLGYCVLLGAGGTPSSIALAALGGLHDSARSRL